MRAESWFRGGQTDMSSALRQFRRAIPKKTGVRSRAGGPNGGRETRGKTLTMSAKNGAQRDLRVGAWAGGGFAFKNLATIRGLCIARANVPDRLDPGPPRAQRRCAKRVASEYWGPVMILKRGTYYAVSVGLVVAVGVVLSVSWYVCETQTHPARVEETWPAGEWPRCWLSQFELPSPENVHFKTRDGLTLAGWFVQGTNDATVILAHGKDGTRAEMLPRAGYLHRGGFSVLLYDSRSRGGSEGSGVTWGVKEPWDIEGAVAYLMTRSDVDPERIGAQGISLGAASGILAAVWTPQIKGVVAESLFRSVNGAIANGFTAVTGWPSFPFAPVAKLICEFRLGVDLDEVVPSRVIGQISPRAVFLIHDLQDEQLPRESAEALFSEAAEPKELWLIPGAKHGQGWQHAPQEYESRVLAFWRETFGIVEPESMQF